MLTILDLPPEILLQFVEYLPGNSIKNVILTCRHFHSVLESTLYESIDWNLEPRDEQPIISAHDVSVKSGELLRRNLRRNGALAQHIRYLRMVGFVRPWGLIMAPYYKTLNREFFRLLTNLRHLRLEGRDLELLTAKVPAFPLLQTMHVMADQYNPHRNRPWFASFRQPSLQNLILTNIHEQQERKIYPERTNRFLWVSAHDRKTFLRESRLQYVLIECAALQPIFQTWCALQSFAYIPFRQKYPNLRVSFNNSVSVSAIQAPAPSCRLVYRRGSLMTLKLDHKQFSRKCKLHLLRMLRRLSTVRVLEIDPVVCMGRRNCGLERRVGRQKRLCGFAEHLPNSIEELSILVDLEQSARLEHYRSELVDSIVQARKKSNRFPRLRRIIFIEHTEYTSEYRCWGKDPFCCYGSVFGWNDDEKRLEQYETMKDTCEEVGIDLEYRDDDFYRDDDVKPASLAD